MAAIGVEYGCKYTLTGPDGTIAVFNDSTDKDFVGVLDPTESSGLDSPEVREDAADAVEEDGAIQGINFYGKRPIVLAGAVIASTVSQRNERVAKIIQACNAMRKDATLSWQPTGAPEKVFVKVRRQQPLRVTKGFVKFFQIPLVAADARILGVTPMSTSASGTNAGPVSKLPTVAKESAYAGAGFKWVNPNNIFSKNNVYTEAFGFEAASEYLDSSGYAFAVPATATVKGIEAFIERKVQVAGQSRDDVVRLRKAGVLVGSNLKSATLWPTSDAVATYGGPTNLWGTTWTPAEINAATFGLTLAVDYVGGEAGNAYVDAMELKVYYEVAPIELSVNNFGNANASPVIKIQGPGDSFTLTNSTTGESLVITANIASFQFLEIDFKNHTILIDGEIDDYESLDFENSDWWSLAPGTNVIKLIVGTGSTTGTKLELEANRAWI